MQPRRSLRLVAGALVLAVPLLGSCGFDKATDLPYTPGEGTNDRSSDVKVLAAVVVAAQPGSGTFIASLSNSATEDEDSFEALSGAGESTDLTIAEVSPAVDLAPRELVNLAEEGGVNVSGDFEAGDMVRLSLSFASGQTTTLNVPVVFACDDYTGLDTSSGGGLTPPDQTEESESPSPGEVPTDASTPTEEPEESEGATSATGGDQYDCAAVLEED
jgi:hypothetical protein